MDRPTRVPYRRIDEDAADQKAPVILEGERMPPANTGFRQHPQVRRLAPYARPLQPHETVQGQQTMGHDMAHGYHGFDPADPRYADPRMLSYPPHQAPSTNVSVNNNGQYYRPWKEELALSFGKSVGNFFAFPIRLIGGLIEGIMNAGLGVLKIVLLAVIAPTLIYTGVQMYQAQAAGGSSTEAAAEAGKNAIGLVGSVLGGIWDGVFGEADEPKADAPAAKQQPAH